jgi:hypothetical protein
VWTRVVHLPSTPTYTIQGQKTDLYALDGISLGFNLNPKQIDTLFCLAYLMCHLCIKFISQKIWEIEFENIKKSSSILSFAICLYYEKFWFCQFWRRCW